MCAHTHWTLIKGREPNRELWSRTMGIMETSRRDRKIQDVYADRELWRRIGRFMASQPHHFIWRDEWTSFHIQVPSAWPHVALKALVKAQLRSKRPNTAATATGMYVEHQKKWPRALWWCANSEGASRITGRETQKRKKKPADRIFMCLVFSPCLRLCALCARSSSHLYFFSSFGRCCYFRIFYSLILNFFFFAWSWSIIAGCSIRNESTFDSHFLFVSGCSVDMHSGHVLQWKCVHMPHTDPLLGPAHKRNGRNIDINVFNIDANNKANHKIKKRGVRSGKLYGKTHFQHIFHINFNQFQIQRILFSGYGSATTRNRASAHARPAKRASNEYVFPFRSPAFYRRLFNFWFVYRSSCCQIRNTHTHTRVTHEPGSM